jgi:hypothetical protein
LIRLKYLADTACLVKRYAQLHGGLDRLYDKNYKPKSKNITHNKFSNVFFPKWSRYSFRVSKYTNKEISEIPIYRNALYCFAIQDAWSRKILCAKLGQSTAISRGIPSYNKFDLAQSLKETFSEYGKPLSIVVDKVIRLRYSHLLHANCPNVIEAVHPSKIGSLENWFGQLLFNMKTRLTQEELDSYVKWWNNKPHSALLGLTPNQAWFCRKQSLLENYAKSLELLEANECHQETNKISVLLTHS